MGSVSHRRGWSCAVLLALFTCAPISSRASDTLHTEYRVDTSEVRVSFFATDEKNRPIDTLSTDDFAIVDGETVVRTFRSLSRSDSRALEIVAVVDASESVAQHFQTNVEHILSLVTQVSSKVGHDFSIVTFAGLQPVLLCSNDCMSGAIRQRLLSTTASGATPLNDTLIYASHFLSKRRSADVRQVVLLFSDGNDTISRASAREALDAIINTGALLYTVNFDPSGTNSRGSYMLEQMAEATGGQAFSMQQDTTTVLESVLADLRASYVVTYSLPTHTPGFHSIRILPKHNLNLRFHCRRGYYYEEDH